MADDLLWAIDVSSHQGMDIGPLIAAHRPTYCVIHTYHRYEAAGLFGYTRSQAETCDAAGVQRDPYTWGFRFADPIMTVRDTIERWHGLGRPIGTLWGDWETYRDQTTFDPGPDAAWLRAFFGETDRLGVEAGHYTGYWWVRDWFPGGPDAFAEFNNRRLWLAAYDGVPDLDAWLPFSGFERLHGKQWDVATYNLDRDVFDPIVAVPGVVQPPAEPPADECQERVNALSTALAHVADVEAPKAALSKLKAQRKLALAEIRRIREQFLGPAA